MNQFGTYALCCLCIVHCAFCTVPFVHKLCIDNSGTALAGGTRRHMGDCTSGGSAIVGGVHNVGGCAHFGRFSHCVWLSGGSCAHFGMCNVYTEYIVDGCAGLPILGG